MEIRQLITFRKVAELQSFSKAAESMGYSQSAVTVQIKALEKEFNVRFFDRYGKTVRITPAGIQFQRRIDRILNELDSLHSDLGEGKLQTHKLHIGTLSSLCSFMLPEMMKRYYSEFPDYHVKITRGSPTELIDMMEHNELDIIYILDALRFDTHWRRVVQKKEAVVFVCAPECRLADRGEVEMEEILEEPLMLTEVNDNYRFALEQYLAFHNLSISPILEVGDPEVILRILRDNGGRGVSFLPYYAVRGALERGELREVSVRDFQVNMHHQIIYYKEKWVTDEMLEFIRIAQNSLM